MITRIEYASADGRLRAKILRGDRPSEWSVTCYRRGVHQQTLSRIERLTDAQVRAREWVEGE